MRMLGSVIKSKSDNRLYRAIKLQNQIECLIISDHQAKKSSAALSVGVGSLQDPLQAQGLAHYLEHMLFMGTKKYPNENDYSNYIAKNFGSSNAYTSQDQTNYHFQVASNAFKQTFDRFAQFFISPLMSDSSSERQLNAVHSEHTKNLLNDAWRKYQLSKFLAKEGHPYKKFSTGNKQSLANPNLRNMLHTFYNNNYSSNLMKLVVCGNQSPEEIVQIIEQKFSSVPNKNYSRFKMSEHPYSTETFNKLYKICPVQDRKVLQIAWTLKDKSIFYQNSPSSYLSYIIGHEGQGSLLSFFTKQGLATGVSAGGHDAYNCYSEFQIQISLTKKGVQQVKTVIEYVINYVEKLKNAEPQKWVFDQLRDVYKIKFDFLEKQKGMGWVSGLAKRMQTRKVEEILEYPYYMKQWKPELIKDYLAQLTKDNMIVFFQAKEVQSDCNQTEPIYKTKFGINNLQSVEKRVCPVKIPPKNPFLPKNFDIFSLGSDQPPLLIRKTDRLQAYFKKDHQFALPKIILKLNLYFDGQNSVKQSLYRHIYLSMLVQKMRQFTYLGDSAQSYSSISFDNYYTVSIQFHGFRDSAIKFVDPYLEQVFAFQPTDVKYFETVKQKLERNLSNYFLGDPYRIAYNLSNMATRYGASNSPHEKLKLTKSVTFEEITHFGELWRKRLYAEAYFTGNAEDRQAQILTDGIERILNEKSNVLPKGSIGQIRAVKIPIQNTWIVEQKLVSPTENNSAVIIHFQQEASSIRSKLIQHLAHNFIKQPAFDYLRTKEQLGYIVMCLTDDNRGVLGMSFLVQSAVKSTYQIVNYIDKFLSIILTAKIEELNQNIFKEYKQSLMSSLMEKDKNLANEAGRYWSQIEKHSYLFNRMQQELEELSTITLFELKNFINLLLYTDSCRRRLEAHVMSQDKFEQNAAAKKQRLAADPTIKVFNDPELLKKQMSLHPDFYAHL